MATTAPDDFLEKYNLPPPDAPDPDPTGFKEKYGLPDPDPPAAQPAPNLARRIVGDTAISAIKGAISVPELAVGLADIPTGGLAGKAAEAIGFKPKQAKEFLDEYLTPEQQAANQRVQEAKGFFPTVGAALQNPSTIVHGVVESLPSMGAGGVVARGLAMPVLGRVAPKLAEGTAGTIAGAVGEGVAGAGSAAEQIRQESPEGTFGVKGAVSAVASGALDTLFGLGGGFLAKKLGIGDIDTMVATGKLDVPAAAAAKAEKAEVAKGFWRRLGEGAISEGVFEELPQSAQEQMWQNYATGKPIMEGVAEAGAQGMLAGAFMGGVAGGISRPQLAKPTGPPPGPIGRAANISQGTAPQTPAAAPAAPAEPALPAGHEVGGVMGETEGPPEPQAEVGPLKRLMPLSEEGAKARNGMNAAQGFSTKIIPHPEVGGAFAVIPDTHGTATDTTGRIAGLLDEADQIISRIKQGRDIPPAVVEHLREIDEQIAEYDKQKAKEDKAAETLSRAKTQSQRAREASVGRSVPYEPTRVGPPLLPAPKPAGFTETEEGGEAEPTYVGDTVDKQTHPQVGPFNLIVENAAGSVRRSKPGAEHQWARKMSAHYGYFRGVPARAPDKDRVDAFIKPGTPTNHAGPAFVIDQNNAAGTFDEPKVMLGYGSQEEAVEAYLEHYPRAQRDRIHGVTQLSTTELRDRLNDPQAFLQPQPESAPIAEGGAAAAEQEPAAAEQETGVPAEPPTTTTEPAAEATGEKPLSDEDLGKMFDEAAAEEAAAKAEAERPAEPETPTEPAPTEPEKPAEPAPEPETPAETAPPAEAEKPPETAPPAGEYTREPPKEVKVFASGMTRPGDMRKALESNTHFGIEIGQLSANGQRVLAEGLKTSDSHVFVDSGAFSLHKRNLKLEGGEEVEKLDFPEVMKRYDDLMMAVATADEDDRGRPNQMFFTMPDVVGDQEATLAALREHTDLVRNSNVLTENRIYPVQAGTMSLLEMYREMRSMMGPNEIRIVGIPANAMAAPTEQVTELLKAEGKNIAAVHFLGAGARDTLTPYVNAALDAGYDGELSGDANRVRSLLYKMGRKAAVESTISDREPERIAHEHRVNEIERDLFATGLSSEPIRELAKLTEAEFMKGAPEILGRRVKELLAVAETPEQKRALQTFLDGDKAKLDSRLLREMYKQAKARAAELEKEANRDPAIYQAAYDAAAIEANIGDTPEMHAAFKEGFDHALKGKTKSTLTSNLMGVAAAGYDAARAWIETEEGRNFYEGKRQAKEKSTGEALRRHWDGLKKGLDNIDPANMKAAWDNIRRSTARADAFPFTLADDATPGARSWMAELREHLGTFSEYFAALAANHSDGRDAFKVFDGQDRYSTGAFANIGRDDDAVRVERTVEMAQNYLTIMEGFARRFEGARTLGDIRKVLFPLFGEDYEKMQDRAFVKEHAALLKAPLWRDASWFLYSMPWKRTATANRVSISSRWLKLLETENDEAANETTRRNPLIRPRLDVIERVGMRADRKGKDISAEEIKKIFGFSDVTIGEYVTATQARDHLNYMHDALMDLAEILGAKPTDLSFGGRLHLAIGALGHGKMAAHFNPGHPLPSGGTVPVINITNTKGDGAVLHEYFHAIDFLTRDARTREVIKEMKEALVAAPKSAETALEIARRFLTGGSWFNGMKRAGPLENAKYALRYYRSHDTDKTQFLYEAERLDAGSAKPYWSNDYEPWARASEAWLTDALLEKKARSDYLQSPGWAGDGFLKPPAYRGIPYPQGQERKGFNALYQSFIDQLEWTKDGPRLKDDAPWRKKTVMAERKEAYRAALAEAEQMLPELQKRFEAENEERKQRREQEKQDKFFGTPPADAAPPVEGKPDPAPSPNDTGPLTGDEYDRLFDDAAAELREGKQEVPEDPGPGHSVAVSDAAQAPREEKADQSASDLIKAAAAEGVKGIDEALTGLAKLFGSKGVVGMGAPFNEESYQKAKPHFEAALQAFIKAGKTLKDLFRLLIQQFGEGIKPYALRFAQEKKLGANLTETPAIEPEKNAPVTTDTDPARPIANWVQMRLEHAQPFEWRDLFQKADEAYGGTQAQGKYSVKDAYDAMELGINQYLLGVPLVEGPKSAIALLERVLAKVPTQSKRTTEQVEYQQFSTPPTHAYLANWVAAVHPGESYLEPSAGIGGLAVFGKKAGAKVAVNELSARRLGLLRSLPFDRFFGENAEHLNAILPADVKPTVIVMNPPFSATAGRVSEHDTMNGAKHVEEALKRLQPGGRLVAIVGEGMGPDRPAFKMWWGKIKKDYTVRANIGIEGKAYAKYGTSFGTQLLVIDKTGPQAGTEVVTGQVETPAGAIQLLEPVRVSRTVPATSTEGAAGDRPPAGIPGGAATAGPGEGDAGGGLPGTATAPGVGGGRPETGTGGATTPGGGTGRADRPDEPPGGRPPGGRGGRAAGPEGDGGRGTTGADGGTQSPAGSPSDLATGAESPLVVESAADAEAAGGEIDNSVFENYTPKKVRIEGAQPHNTPLVESAALATVQPPDVNYKPRLPPALIQKGDLSLAQLESIVYAGQSHGQMLTDGKTRRGHFIGDGTGVGKGRQISGIIIDNWNHGRKRAVWFSEKARLIEDARRDFRDIGGDPNLIHAHHGQQYAIGKKIDLQEGVLFSTYSLLRGSSKQQREAKKKGDFRPGAQELRYERVNQIVEWLGKDFDGVIAFDEAHNMANATAQGGARGAKPPSEQALAAIELQRALPNARVEYVSATGATEISNLAYAERLGLWGQGTPFENVAAFTAELGRSVTIMELVAQNMKQLGLYNARSLSFNGGTPETTVTYDRVEHQLTDYQRGVYNELAQAWQVVLQNIHAALEDTGVTDEGKGKNRDSGKIKANVLSQFWGTHQRFFNQVITALQMPSVLDKLDADMKDGKAVVLQLTNTNEADQARALAKHATKRGGAELAENEEIEELDLTPRDALINFVMKAFPVNVYQETEDEEGHKKLEVVRDSKGDPVVSPEALAKRAAMIEMIQQVKVPDAPLQLLINHFGPDKIAEVTGRTERTVPGEKGGFKVEKRNAAAVTADIQAFKDDKKQILVFSNAGGTGVSFHNDRRIKNKRPRSHYILQAGWSADRAMQGMGRTHRTNQVSAPTYFLITTDIPAQKRFISSIARRLEQLGALTAGQRNTAGGSLFSSSDNLESQYAVRAVRQFFTNLVQSNISQPGYAELGHAVLNEMGLPGVRDEETGELNDSKLPSITQFLNRLLSLTLDRQEKAFKLFSDEMDMQIETAKREGSFDDGMRTITHVGARPLAENTVYQDDRTGAQTKHYEIEVNQNNRFYHFPDVDAILRSASRGTWFKNKKSGRVQGVWLTNSTRTDKDGKIHQVYGVYRTSGVTYETADKMEGGNLERLDSGPAGELWRKENEARSKTTHHRMHMVVGSVLPIWNRFQNEHVDVARIRLDDGRRLLGRVIAEKDIEQTLGRLNVKSAAAQMTGKDVIRAVMSGATVRMSNRWQFERSLVSGQPRIEITGLSPSRTMESRMVAAGVFSEIISHKQRFFVPTDRPDTIDKLMEQFSMNPVAVTKPEDAPKFSRAPAPDAVIVSTTAKGDRTYDTKDVSIDFPTRFGKTTAQTGGNVVYTVFDQTQLAEGAERKAAQVGIMELETSPAGLVTSLNALFINRDRQGRRYGEKALRAILSSLPEGATLKISHILPESKAFWEKMGTRVYPGRMLDDGELTRSSYEQARGRIEDGTGASRLVWESRRVSPQGAAEGGAGVRGAQPAGARAARRGQHPEVLRSDLVKRLGAAIPENVKIIDSWSELPGDLLGEVVVQGAYDVQGIYSPASDTTYLVASNIPRGAGLAVYLHEVGVHKGLREFIGEQAFDQLAGQIDAWSRARVPSEEVRLAMRAAARVPADLSRADAAEELVAYFVEEAVLSGHDASEAGVLGKWLRQLIDAIKRAINKVTGGKIADLTSQEIVALARGAAQHPMARRAAGEAAFSMADTHPLQFADATDSRLYRERTAADVPTPTDADIARALASDATAKRIMAKGVELNPGDRVGVRLNLNVLKNTGVAVQTLHRGSPTPGYTRGKGWFGNEVISYQKTVTLKDAYFNVGQRSREAIATGVQSKHHMASIDGEFIRNDEPNFDGIEVSFNPKRVHLFVDANNYAVRSAEEVTVYGHRAYLRGRVEYYGKATTPARQGEAPTAVVPTTKFSLAANDEPTQAATSVRARMLSAVREMTGGQLAEDEGVLNAWNKTVGTPELIARKNEAFRRFFWEGQAYLNDINRGIAESEAALPSWFKGQDVLSRWFDRVRGKEVANAKQVTKALLDGTLADKVWTEEQLRERGLSPREIEMYEEARNAVDAILERSGVALIKKEAAEYAPIASRLVRIFRDGGLAGIEDFVQYGVPVGKARIEHLESQLSAETNPEIRDILKRRIAIEEKRLQEWKIVVQAVERINKLQREGYFPLSRFGKHYVSVTDPRGQPVEFRMYEGEALARAGAVQMARRYPMYDVRRGTLSQHTHELFRGLTPESVELFAEILGQDQDPVMQAYLKEAVANRSQLKRMIHRRGTEGYSDDAVRVLADFISVNARYASRLAHASNLTEYAHDIRGGELRDYAIKLNQYLTGQDGREEYHAVRGFLFFQYIGGNVSSALLNLTQVPMFTLPWLTRDTSVANAGKILTNAYKAALSTEPEGVPGELGVALRRAEDEGLTDPQNVYSTMAIAGGSRLARVRAFSSFLDAWAFLFGRAERLNRRVTFMAAYQLAQQNPSVLQVGQTAYDYAATAVHDTQLIYNKGNRPAWARGIGAIPFTFKLFTIGMLENIFSRMPVRQRLMILALMMLGAGGEGLPFAEDIEDILDTIGQKLGYATNTKRALKEGLDAALQDWLGLPRDTALYASELMRRGVFANTPLATFGPRIGMGNIIPGSSILLTGRDIGGELAEAGGPAASLVRNIGAAGELVARGDYGRAAEKVLPSAAANVLKGTRQLAEGKEVSPFGKPVAEVPPEQALLQTLGVSSQKVAHARERTEIVKQNEAYLKVIEDRIADKWARAIVEKDPEAKAEAMQELREHNERNPDQKIRISPVQIMTRAKNMRRDPEKELIRSVAKERRAQAREFLSQP